MEFASNPQGGAPSSLPDGIEAWGKLNAEQLKRLQMPQAPGAETYFIEGPDSNRIAVEVSGPEDGYPIIIHHGSPGSRLMDMGGIIPSGAKLIIPDRRGYGMSTAAPGERHPNVVHRRPHHVAQDASYILRALGIKKFGVIGRSGGTASAMATARLPGAESLALVVPIAPPILMGKMWRHGMHELGQKIFDILFESQPSRLRLFGYDIGNSSYDHVRPLVQQLADHLLSSNHLFSSKKSSRTIGEIGGTGTDAAKTSHAEGLRHGIEGWMQDLMALQHWGVEGFGPPDTFDIRVPTLLIAAERDTLTPPAHAEWLKARIKQDSGRLPGPPIENDRASDLQLHIMHNADHGVGTLATYYAILWSQYHAGVKGTL